MVPDWSRSARGALAGAAAAAVWAAQQPLDRRVFGVPYSDSDLLGSWVTRGPARTPLGVAAHVANGAAFGALYALLAPRLPVPAWARGPLAGLAEHAATWPGTALLPRVHPRGDALPALWGSWPALGQATWRHLVFGVVLGELERRLNREPAAQGAPPPGTVSGNGHGSVERLVPI